MKYGLKITVTNKIRSIFEQYPAVEKVILYGSRAMGNYRIGSDIDFALKGNLTERDYYNILLDLDDLMLPYMMDVTRLTSIENRNLIDHINRRGVVFYERMKILQ